MTKQECEERIESLLLEIGEIYKEYNPDGDYLTLCCFVKQGDYFFNNDYPKKDKDKPINKFINKKSERV